MEEENWEEKEEEEVWMMHWIWMTFVSRESVQFNTNLFYGNDADITDDYMKILPMTFFYLRNLFIGIYHGEWVKSLCYGMKWHSVETKRRIYPEESLIR